MSLYSDTQFMLRRSSESPLKVETTLRKFKKDIRQHGESEVYKGLSPKVRYNLCCARILQRDFSQWDGWQYRDEWAEAMHGGIKDVPLWDGRPVDRLLVVAEQGIGDEILWASVLPEAMIRCKEVTYACDSRLVDLLARSLPGLRTVVRQRDARDDVVPGHDALIPAADLFPLFRRRPGDFPRRPFLRPDPARLPEMECYRGRVGVSWRGRHGVIDPLSLGIDRPLSLQYDEQRLDIEAPHVDLRNDIEGVVALCSVLNNVVTVPTSVWHMAAAVGTPTRVVIAPRGSESDGVVDELDWHCPEGLSPFYMRSCVFRGVKEYRCDPR